jgi:superfamily II DNA or RNA helicase
VSELVLANALIVPAAFVPMGSLEAYQRVIKDRDGNEEVLNFWKMQGDAYLFARGHRENFRRFFSHYKIHDIRSKAQMDSRTVKTPEGFGLRFTGALRPNQQKVVAAVLSGDPNGLIEAPPRFGKTVVMTYLATKFGFKTIFLAHQIDLGKQLYKTFVNHTNTLEVECLLGRQVVGMVESLKDLDELDVAIMSYQKFASDKGSAQLFAKYKDRFGMLFVDEAHKANAPVFASVVEAFNSYGKIAVSCTADTWIALRVDGRIESVRVGDFPERFGCNSNHPSGWFIEFSSDHLVECLSVNRETGLHEWRKVTHWHKYPNTKEIVEVYRGKAKTTGTRITTDHSLILRDLTGRIHDRSPLDLLNAGKNRSDGVAQYWTIPNKRDLLIRREIVVDLLPIVIGRHGAVARYKNQGELLKAVSGLDLTPSARYRFKAQNAISLGFYDGKAEVWIDGPSFSYPIERCVSVNKYLQWVLGYFIGDGSLAKGSVVFYSAPKDIPILLHCLKKSGLSFRHRVLERKPGKMAEVYVSSPGLRYLIEHFHADQKAASKRLHPDEYEFTHPLWFLSGLMQSDGHHNRLNKLASASLGGRLLNSKARTFVSCNEPLIRDLALWFQLYGCKYSVGKRRSKDHVSTNGLIKGTIGWYVKTGSIRAGNARPQKVTFESRPHVDFVYDLTVEENENFLGNDLMLHNTGTVDRKDGLEVVNEFTIGPVIARGEADQLPCQVKVVETGITVPVQTRNIKIFHSKSCAFLADSGGRNQLLLSYISAYANAGHYCVVAVERQSHCQFLADSLNQAGIPAEAFHAKRFKNEDQREAVLQRCRRGDAKVLVAIRSMLLGIDLPRFSAFFCAIPTANKPNYYQEYCRVRTPFPGKQMGFIVDFVDRDPNFYLNGYFSARKKLYEKENFQIT